MVRPICWMVAGIIASAAPFASAVLNAQAPQDEGARVTSAAITHMAELLRENDRVPPGQVAFDPRVLRSREMPNPAGPGYVVVYELAEAWPDSLATAISQLTSARPGEFECARVCATESLRSCTLPHFPALFATSEPVIRADSAEVVVKAMWLSDLAKQPVQDGVFLVTLRRGPAGWTAVATRTLQIS